MSSDTTVFGEQEDEEKELSPADSKAWAERWTKELSAGRKELQDWHKKGNKIIKRFRNERDSDTTTSRLPLFSSGIITQHSIMLGQTPRVNAARRHADAQDDVARVAAEMMERHLNTDIERGDDGYTSALDYCLQDSLLPGMTWARLRYVAEFEDVEVEAKMGVKMVLDPMTGQPIEQQVELAPAYSETRKAYEAAEVDWVHWRDVVWSPCRVFHEMRWVAFRAQMGRKEGKKRFGAVFLKAPLNSDDTSRSDGDSDDKRNVTPWSRADVWEIWSLEHKKVFWLVEGMDKLLDVKKDPLRLRSFWPCPKPIIANATTDTMVPRPDFLLHEDLLDEIDVLCTRIQLLEETVRATGVYDQTNGGVKDVIEDKSVRNKLYPVANWNAFAEKGGLRNAIEWLPLDQIVGALTTLRDVRREAIDLYYQVSGQSDIMRGQATQAGATATEQSAKVKFGSVRMQRKQDEFARFASDIQALKAELIEKHFDAETIIECSNIRQTQDAQYAQAAVELIKSGKFQYRVEVKPENVSLTDFAALKSERSEVLTSIAAFLQAVAPMAQVIPGSMQTMLEILQWSVSGMRGASTIEGVLDRAIAQSKQQAEQAAQNPQPEQNPEAGKLMAIQAKGQMDLAREDKKLQNALVLTQAEVQADGQREANQREQNTLEAAAKASITHAYRNSFGNGTNGGVP